MPEKVDEMRNIDAVRRCPTVSPSNVTIALIIFHAGRRETTRKIDSINIPPSVCCQKPKFMHGINSPPLMKLVHAVPLQTTAENLINHASNFSIDINLSSGNVTDVVMEI